MSLAVFLTHPHPSDPRGGSVGNVLLEIKLQALLQSCEPEGAIDLFFLSFLMHSEQFQGTLSLVKENCIFLNYYSYLEMVNSYLGSRRMGR